MAQHVKALTLVKQRSHGKSGVFDYGSVVDKIKPTGIGRP